MATVVFGRVRERARERKERAGESEREQGGIGTGCGRRPRGQEGVGKQEVAENARARATLPLCLLAGGRRRLCPWWAGPLQCQHR